MPERILLCPTSEIPAGTGREFVAFDRIVAVFNVNGDFHAMDGICPHAGGPLAAGCLFGGIVTCPWHGWQFDVTTGRHQLTPRIQQQRFSVALSDGMLYLEPPVAS